MPSRFIRHDDIDIYTKVITLNDKPNLTIKLTIPFSTWNRFTTKSISKWIKENSNLQFYNSLKFRWGTLEIIQNDFD